MTDHAELRRIALAATPGPWGSPWLPGSKQECAGVEKSGSHYIVLHCEKGYHPDTVEMWKRDCQFIAAFNPSVALDLIHEIAVLQRALELAAEDSLSDLWLTRRDRMDYWRSEAEREIAKEKG